jgi:hypothetical protein
LGERLSANRMIYIGDSFEHALQMAIDTAGPAYDYFQSFGNLALMQEDPANPVVFDDPRDLMLRMHAIGHLICGTVDDVKRQLSDVRECHGAGGNLESITWAFLQQGAMSIDDQRRQLELLLEDVLPSLG